MDRCHLIYGCQIIFLLQSDGEMYLQKIQVEARLFKTRDSSSVIIRLQVFIQNLQMYRNVRNANDVQDIQDTHKSMNLNKHQ